MKFVVVDVQGYIFKSGFCAKEIAVYDGKEVLSWVFKPKISYHDLTEQEMKQVKYCSEKFHGIHYNFGDTDADDISFIISSYLSDVDIIYVKGDCKVKFLTKVFSHLKYNLPSIVNLKNYNGVNFRLEKSITDCPYHNLDICMCSVKNVKDIYKHVFDCLPK